MSPVYSENLVDTRSRASSQVASSSTPLRRINGLRNRSELLTYSRPNLPLKQAWPRLAGELRSGTARMKRPAELISRLSWQPTGQWGQMVRSTRAAFSHLWSRSTRAPTGQTSMQAPQNSHPDSSRDVPNDVPTSAEPLLSVKQIASSPRSSSQARTQRPQTMHRL